MQRPLSGWELNAQTVGGRLRALQLGHPDLGHVRPYYRRCEAPLYQEAHQVAATVAERKIGLVILDSAAMACGGELSSPDAAIQLQQALRRIGCASLLLAHVAKNVQEGQERSAYGTVFFRELARNVWELSRAHNSNPVQVVLEHKKDNFSSMRDPLGFAIQFDGDAVRVQSSDVNAQPEFEDKLPLYARIRNLLESDGMPRSAQVVASEVGEKLKVVQATLSRYRGHKWSMIGENRNAQWTVLSRWIGQKSTYNKTYNKVDLQQTYSTYNKWSNAMNVKRNGVIGDLQQQPTYSLRSL